MQIVNFAYKVSVIQVQTRFQQACSISSADSSRSVSEAMSYENHVYKAILLTEYQALVSQSPSKVLILDMDEQP